MYKIIVTRSLFNHFFWTLLASNNKKLSESNMHATKDICMRIVKPIAKRLKAKIIFINLEKECEE